MDPEHQAKGVFGGMRKTRVATGSNQGKQQLIYREEYCACGPLGKCEAPVSLRGGGHLFEGCLQGRMGGFKPWLCGVGVRHSSHREGHAPRVQYTRCQVPWPKAVVYGK